MLMDWIRKTFFPRSVEQDRRAQHVHEEFDRLNVEMRNASTDDLITSLVHNKRNRQLKRMLEE